MEMKEKTRRRRLSAGASHFMLAALLASGGLFGLSGQALAQDQPAAAGEEEAIVVTGSRIHTDPLTNRQPVTQIGEEEIARTGLAATADVLQRLPVSGGGLNT